MTKADALSERAASGGDDVTAVEGTGNSNFNGVIAGGFGAAATGMTAAAVLYNPVHRADYDRQALRYVSNSANAADGMEGVEAAIAKARTGRWEASLGGGWTQRLYSDPSKRVVTVLDRAAAETTSAGAQNALREGADIVGRTADRLGTARSLMKGLAWTGVIAGVAALMLGLNGGHTSPGDPNPSADDF